MEGKIIILCNFKFKIKNKSHTSGFDIFLIFS